MTTFGAGTYNVTGMITMGGGSTTTFGAGTFNVGTGSCSGTNGYSICNTGTSLTFAGPRHLRPCRRYLQRRRRCLWRSEELARTTNSYNIGKASDG